MKVRKGELEEGRKKRQEKRNKIKLKKETT
jgi:hypothetical protein